MTRRAFYLDNSAFNCILDNPTGREAYYSFLQKGEGRVVISAANVLEAMSTPPSGRRLELLQILSKTTGENRPLALPPSLLKAVTLALALKREEVDIAIPAEHSGAWKVLQSPEEFTDEDAAVADSERRGMEDVYRRMHEEGRDAIQGLLSGFDPPPPQSCSRFLKSLAANKNFLRGSMASLIKDWDGSKELSGNEEWLVEKSVFWRCFMASYGISIFNRAFPDAGYGPKRNPGFIDIWQATYLPVCDVFVTNDQSLRRHGRMISALFSPRPCVISYDRFIADHVSS